MELDEGTDRKVALLSSRVGDDRLPVVIWEGGRLDEYLDWKISSGAWNENSAYGFRRTLIQFDRVFDGQEVTSAAVQKWITGTGLSANYRRSRWSVVRGFLKWAGVELDLVAPPVPTPVPRPLRDVDIGKLLSVCDVRDEVIVSLGICEGLRRSEMVHLEMADIDLEGQVLFVNGKGGKQRWTPLTKATQVRIERYVEAERGSSPGPLLVSRTTGRGLRPATISERSCLLMKRAGIFRDGVNLHALRHTAATRLWMETNDLFMTQQLLGHSNIRTTSIYVRGRPTAEMREAMNRCST